MVRFAAESSAKAAWQKAVDEAEDGKVKLGEAELQATVIEGELSVPSLLLLLWLGCTRESVTIFVCDQ